MWLGIPSGDWLAHDPGHRRERRAEDPSPACWWPTRTTPSLSRLLLGAMGQGRAGDIIQAEGVDQQAGRQRLDRGEATALLVIPKGFSEALLKEEPTRLLLVVNPRSGSSRASSRSCSAWLPTGRSTSIGCWGPSCGPWRQVPPAGERRSLTSRSRYGRLHQSDHAQVGAVRLSAGDRAANHRRQPPSADAVPKLSPASCSCRGSS